MIFKTSMPMLRNRLKSALPIVETFFWMLPQSLLDLQSVQTAGSDSGLRRGNNNKEKRQKRDFSKKTKKTQLNFKMFGKVSND